ncbi:MAG: hypothetical protein ABWY29_07190 [Blastococcus sp.]
MGAVRRRVPVLAGAVGAAVAGTLLVRMIRAVTAEARDGHVHV